jgi:hypothetical protein
VSSFEIFCLNATPVGDGGICLMKTRQTTLHWPTCFLLGTTKQKLTDLVVGAKLAQWRATTLCFRNDNIKSLCGEHQINMELDHSTLTSYTGKKRVIRIGEGEGPRHARNQFSDAYLNPPRISHRCPRRLLLLDRLDRLLRPETETEDQQSIKQAYLTQRDAILTNDFLLSVLGSSFDFHHEVFMRQEDALAKLEEGILDTANKLRQLKQQSSKSVRRVIGAKDIEEDLIPGHYPALTSLGVDLSDDFHVKSLLRDIIRMAKDVSSTELLSFGAENDKPTTLVQIPRTGRYDLFHRGLRKSPWVNKILDGMKPVSSGGNETALDPDGDDEVGTTREDGARWLITRDKTDPCVAAVFEIPYRKGNSPIRSGN